MSESFQRNAEYTRRDVLRALGIRDPITGGNWFTGYNEHGGAVYIFANVGTPGRTGHDYDNAWENGKLRWFAKKGTTLGQPQIRRIISPGIAVHVFWRSLNDAPFRYAGRAKAIETKDTSPVEVLWSFD